MKPKRSPSASPKDWTLLYVHTRFSTEEACLEHLEVLRWNGQTPRCLRCKGETVCRLKSRPLWECWKCSYQFSATTGHPVFHATKLPLPKWFIAIYLICSSKKSISAKQLQRDLGVTYKTAYRVGQQIRKGMKNELPHLLGGIVEADETWTGGKQRGFEWRKGARARGRVTKFPVFGMLQRGGETRAYAVPDVRHDTLEPLLSKHVDRTGAKLYTDQHIGYSPLRRKGWDHHTVNHLEQYVDGEVHTNGIESFWSLLKRGIVGQFHSVRRHKLQAYLDEFTCRFNARHGDEPVRTVAESIIAKG